MALGAENTDRSHSLSLTLSLSLSLSLSMFSHVTVITDWHDLLIYRMEIYAKHLSTYGANVSQPQIYANWKEKVSKGTVKKVFLYLLISIISHCIFLLSISIC